MISFPGKPSSVLDNEFLQNLIKEMLTTNPKNQIKDLKTSEWHKGKAVDFDLENEGASVNGKAFIEGDTVYVLSVATTPEFANPQEFNFFVNSFQLMPR